MLYMMFIYKTAKCAPVWTTILKIREIFVHQTLTEHALSSQLNLSFIGRVCHPDLKNLSSRQQSNCLKIAINMTVDFKPITQEQRGNGPDQLH